MHEDSGCHAGTVFAFADVFTDWIGQKTRRGLPARTTSGAMLAVACDMNLCGVIRIRLDIPDRVAVLFMR